MNKPVDPAQIVAAQMEALAGRLTELVSISRGLALNQVLWSGVRLLDPAGVATVHLHVPFAHVVAYAFRTGGTVTVVAGPPGSAPQQGAGMLPVPPGAFIGVPMAGPTLTVYGSPSDMVWLGVWARPQPPCAGYVPGPVVAEPVPAVSGLVSSVVPATYYGFSLRTTGAVEADVRIRDGSATGTILDTVALIAGESAREDYAPGLLAPNGLYFELVAGAGVEGSIRHSGS